MLSETGILYSALAILVLPLASYVITFFFGKMLPRKGDFVGVTFMGVAWYLAIRIFITFWKIGDPSYRMEKAFTWLDLGGFVSETIGLDDVEEAFHKMERGDVLRSVVVL